jgi:predicted ArsR family transcriptional regulator
MRTGMHTAMAESTKRELDVLLVLLEYPAEHSGELPSLSELAGVLELTKAGVQRHVDALTLKGKAELRPGKGWAVTKNGRAELKRHGLTT